MLKNLLFIYLLIVSSACLGQHPGNAKMPDAFYKCWTASPEEDIDDNSISDTYRPCDFKEFRKGLFRKKMEFFKNGKCTWLKYAPNDKDSLINGEWFYKRGKVAIKNEKKEIVIIFKIEHLAFNQMNIVIKYE